MTKKGIGCQIKSKTYNTLYPRCFGCIFDFNLKQNSIMDEIYGLQQRETTAMYRVKPNNENTIKTYVKCLIASVKINVMGAYADGK